MSNLDLTSKQWVDLVFEGKNKDFGAYEMRRESTSRHNKAMLIVAICTLVVIFLPSLVRFVTPNQKEKVTEVTTISKLPPPEVKNNDEIKKLDAPPPPPLKSSIKFTAPVIKKDEEVNEEEEIKTQDELTDSKVTISIADVKGNDELHGKLISDLESIAEEKPKEVKEQTFMSVEQMPQFPGGDAALMQFLAKNLRYPAIAEENGVQGVVTVRFVVSKNGDIQNPEVMTPVDRALDEEALRVIKNMPKWIPGKQNGNNVAVYFMCPVRFVIKN